MKRGSLRKIWMLLLTVSLLAFVPAIVSSAAARPGSVTEVTVGEINGKKATLTWTEVPEATGYNVYRINPDTGKIMKRVSRTAKTSCKVTVNPGTLYSFRVFAYQKNNGSLVESKKGSPIANIQVPVLRQLCYGSGYVFLEWTEVKNATGYFLYRYNASKRAYQKVKTIWNKKTTSYKAKVPVGTTYKFKLRSFVTKNGKRTVQGTSNVLSVKGKKVESVHGRLWLAQLKKTIKVKDTQTGKKVTIPKGTTVSVGTKTQYGNVTIIMSGNNKRYVTAGADLDYGELILAPRYDYYTANQAEFYVNSRKYSSKTDYLIWISQYTSSVHFFKGSQGHWKQQRVAQVILGTGSKGYTIGGQHELLSFDGSHTYFYWSNEMNWGQSFHGWVDENRWGYYSSGCVRMGPSDLAYLRSLPMGTKVISD